MNKIGSLQSLKALRSNARVWIRYVVAGVRPFRSSADFIMDITPKMMK